MVNNSRTLYLYFWSFVLGVVFFGCGNKEGGEASIVYVVDGEKIMNSTEDFFIDGEVEVNLTDAVNSDEKIVYSISRIGPSPTCGTEKGCESASAPSISWGILRNDLMIYSNYMCDRIGISGHVTNGMHDIYCGYDVRLVWDGEKYYESKRER